jgi:CPA2 family monovalent cation:H+ antiporter-2
VALVLLVILGTGWLTQLVGLSMALGAFLAGLVLAETEYRHQVESDIKPFKGLLLGLFFVGVGMSIDLALVVGQAFWILASVAGLVVLKAAILTGLGLAFGLPLPVALRAGALLGEVGEFAFVVVGAAMAAGLMPHPAGHFMLALTGLSILLTPGLAWAGERLGRRFESEAATRELGPGDRPADELENHVLIAGFGRVGQTVAELLDQQKVPYVAIDLDAHRIKDSRSRGRPVYYGDATRRDVLERLGAAKAAALVVTLDSPEAAKRTVAVVAKGWPGLKMFVRAHDATHLAELKALGAADVVPETLESSLTLARHALQAVGAPAEAAARLGATE